MADPAEIEALLDQRAIERTLFDYARGVDRKDWDLVRSTYHPDATDHHGDYQGDLEGFISHLKARHEDIEQSIHLITNVIVERTGLDAALVESYYLCYQRRRLEAASTPGTIGAAEALQSKAVGRYVDRFERRAGAWRVARRKVVFEILESVPAQVGGGLAPGLLVSRRDRSDVLWLESRSG